MSDKKYIEVIVCSALSFGCMVATLMLLLVLERIYLGYMFFALQLIFFFPLAREIYLMYREAS